MSLPVPIAILLSSLLAMGLASVVFRDRPASRRLFIITLMFIFALVPLLCLIFGLQLRIGVPGDSLPQVTIAGIDRASLLLLGSGLMLVGVQLLLVFRARSRLNQLPLMRDEAARGLLEELAPALGVSGEVVVRTGVSNCSSSLGSRLIVLANDSDSWQQETRQAVLAHELVHLSRRDDLWLLLARLLMLQFWWLPWLRLLPRYLEAAIEESCDDLAAYLMRSEQRYLHGVFRAVKGLAPVPSGTAQAAGGSVLERFRRFSTYRDQQLDSRGLYWASLTLLTSLALVWTVKVVPLSEPLPDDVRIVGTAAEGGGESLSVRLGDPPLTLNDDVTRTELPTSDHDPP